MLTSGAKEGVKEKGTETGAGRLKGEGARGPVEKAVGLRGPVGNVVGVDVAVEVDATEGGAGE